MSRVQFDAVVRDRTGKALSGQRIYVLQPNGSLSRADSVDGRNASAVSTFLSGETLASGYTEETGGSALTQPLITDAEGQVPTAWFEADAYDIYLPDDSLHPLVRWDRSVSEGISEETDPVASAALDTHEALTTTAHGGIVANDDSRLSDARTPTTHASSHATGGSDALSPSDIGAADEGHTHPQSDITDLTSDLAAKAPLASPTFTGVPKAPTATAGTDTTQLATTAFVKAAVDAGGGGVSEESDPVATALLTASGLGVVVHGATSSTARPTGYKQIIWIGTVEPANATTNDIYITAS